MFVERADFTAPKTVLGNPQVQQWYISDFISQQSPDGGFQALYMYQKKHRRGEFSPAKA